MLDPEQVRRLRETFAAQPETIQFEGRWITTLELARDSPGSPSSLCRIGEAKEKFYPPEIIIGSPVEPSCLNGLDHRSFAVPTVVAKTLRNARVIGNTTALSADGGIHFPDERQPATSALYDFEVSAGHQGYVMRTSPQGGERVSFVSRRAARQHDLNAVFLHNIEPTNFGSFIFRQLPQLLHLKQDRLAFDCFIVSARTPWLMEALWLAGLDDKPVFSLNEVTGDIFASIQLYNRFDAEGMLGGETRRLMKNFTTEVLSQTCRQACSARRVYVSRGLASLTRPNYRQLLNESEVEASAKRLGYDIIHPETLSFRQQVATFASAEKILGPSGSGMLNAAFNQCQARVFDVETFNVSVRQRAKVYCSAQTRYAFGFVTPETEDSSPLLRRRWTMPIGLLDQAIAWLEA